MMQAQPCDNTLPLEATLLSQKLKQAPTPWANHFIGKGHLGYPTTDHLPVNRGFDTHLGYLMGPSSAPPCAARTLNDTGPSRVTLSLR